MVWTWLSGRPKSSGGGTPTVDLDAIALALTQRLGVLVSCSLVDDEVVAEIVLRANTDASRPEPQIINRLERFLQRAAALIRLD